MSTASPNALKVFLSYSSEDRLPVRKLYAFLDEHGFDVWMDEKKLLPGQEWDYEIQTALHNADAVIVVFSKNMLQKEGYIQRELRMALDRSQEKPEGTIYLIPAKLEECDVPSKWRHLQYIDLNQPDSGRKLIEALNTRARHLPSRQQAVLHTQLHMGAFAEADHVPAVHIEETVLPLEYGESLQLVHFYALRLVSVTMGFFAALNLRWLSAAYTAVNNTHLSGTVMDLIATSKLVFGVMAIAAMAGAFVAFHVLDLFQFGGLPLTDRHRYLLSGAVGYIAGAALNIIGILFLLSMFPCLLGLLLLMGGSMAFYWFSRNS